MYLEATKGPVYRTYFSFVEHQQVLHVTDALIALSHNKYSLSRQPELLLQLSVKKTNISCFFYRH